MFTRRFAFVDEAAMIMARADELMASVPNPPSVMLQVAVVVPVPAVRYDWEEVDIEVAEVPCVVQLIGWTILEGFAITRLYPNAVPPKITATMVTINIIFFIVLI